jgi:hypothetical protein
MMMAVTLQAKWVGCTTAQQHNSTTAQQHNSTTTQQRMDITHQAP